MNKVMIFPFFSKLRPRDYRLFNVRLLDIFFLQMEGGDPGGLL